MRLIASILFALIACTSLQAQKIWFTQGAVGIEARSLLVGLRTADPDVLKKFNKKQEAEKIAYMNSVNDFNRNIQEAMKSVWTLHEQKDIRFMTMPEIFEFTKSKKEAKNYAFITHVTPNPKLFADRGGTAMSNMDVVLCDFFEKPVTSTLMPHVNPTYGELVWGLHQLQDQLEGLIKFRGDMNEVIEPGYLSNYKSIQLRELTLLIDKATVNENFELSQLKEAYQWKFELVDKSVIEEKIKAKAESYAYWLTMPANNSLSGSMGDARESFLTFQHQISKCTDSELLWYAAPDNAPEYMFKFGPINLKHFQYLSECVFPTKKKK